MRGKMLVLSSLLVVASGQSWGCKVSVGEGDLDNRSDEEGRDAGAGNDGGTAGKTSKPPKGGAGGSTAGRSGADGGVAGSSGSQAGRSGSGAGTSGGAGTGSGEQVPGNTMLSDLDEADATALCEQFAEEIAEIIADDDVARVNCTLDALFIVLAESPDGEVDVEACEAEADSCIEQGLGEGTTECEVDELVTMTASCEATVTEYLGCNRGLAQQYADALDQFTCEAFADPMAVDDAILALDANKVPACVTLLGKCPELGGN